MAFKYYMNEKRTESEFANRRLTGSKATTYFKFALGMVGAMVSCT